MKRVVPFVRELRRGSRGRDVVAVKRALWRAGVYGKPRTFTRFFGPFAVRALRAFQKRQGLIVDGVYGPVTHRALAPWFDDYAVSLLGAKPASKTDPDDAVRARILTAAAVLYNRRGIVHYTQTARRMQTVREKLSAKRLATIAHLYEDCSSGATGLYYVAGAPDPNGRGYDGFGYTGTLCQHGRRVRLEDAKPGALVFYGSGPPYSHVAVYLGGGRVWSHGSEGGPYLLPARYRRDLREVREYPLAR